MSKSKKEEIKEKGGFIVDMKKIFKKKEEE